MTKSQETQSWSVTHDYNAINRISADYVKACRKKVRKIIIWAKQKTLTSPKGGDNSVNFHSRVMELTVYCNLNMPNTCVKYQSFSINSFWEIKYLSQKLSEKLS